MLHPGLYEQIINNALNCELSEILEVHKTVAPIDKAELPIHRGSAQAANVHRAQGRDRLG